MKYILLFLCILSLSCKYNVANPVATLKDYTEGSGIIYYVSSSATVAEIEEELKKNKHSLGKYKIVVLTSDSTSTQILNNIATALKNNSSFNNVEVDISKLEGITEIPESVFKDVKNLGSISLSDKVTKINKEAFSGCSSLNDVRFSGELTTIGEGAFLNCSALTLVMLSSEVLTNISANAFYGNSSLVNLVLPANISNVGSTAFSSCNQLKNVEYLGTNRNVEGSPFSSGSSPNNLYLPSATNSTISNYFNGKSFLGKTWTIHTRQHIPN